MYILHINVYIYIYILTCKLAFIELLLLAMLVLSALHII